MKGVLATDDVSPVDGDLVFAHGEAGKDIVFNVKPDATPEILEVRYHVKIEDVTSIILYTADFNYGDITISFT